MSEILIKLFWIVVIHALAVYLIMLIWLTGGALKDRFFGRKEDQ